MSGQLKVHTLIQAYLDKVYSLFDPEIKKTLHFTGNEIYGEILYYSAVKLIKNLDITPGDHFLDIGSGLGKLGWYVYLTSRAASVTGIEINSQRHAIATHIKEKVQEQLPNLFQQRDISFLEGDFLVSDFNKVTIAYLCSTIFSYDLLDNMGKKLNAMPNLKQIASFRKLPYLSDFRLVKKLLIHCSWERVGCYIYERKS